jgi:hypothetical protein
LPFPKGWLHLALIPIAKDFMAMNVAVNALRRASSTIARRSRAHIVRVVAVVVVKITEGSWDLDSILPGISKSR